MLYFGKSAINPMMIDSYISNSKQFVSFTFYGRLLLCEETRASR